MPTRTYSVSSCRWMCIVSCVLLLAAAAQAQITPSDDAYIDTAKPTANLGAAVTLDVSGATQASYITFDLSSIPAGFTGRNIAKASLKLYVNTVTTAGSFNVDYVNGSWTESKINSGNAPPPGTTIAASVPLAKTQALDYVLIDVTSAVQAWLNGTEPNYGIALVANSTFSATFDSKESKTQSHPPELDVVFAGGGGGGIQGVLTGTGSGLQGGGTSGTLNLSLLTSCSNSQVLSWTSSNGWACTNMGGGGGGTVTSVGLAAPSTDFIVTGSPITTSGTLGLGWLVAPDPNNTANAIVKRDSFGNFSASTINGVSGFNLGGYPFGLGSWTAQNAFLGFSGNAKTTGTGNSGHGFQALLNNTSGNANTASGDAALYSNTGGAGNTATGFGALYTNTTGYGNTASGMGALYSNVTGGHNSAHGTNSLYSNTGDNNTAAGDSSLFNNTSGYQNTAIGSNALYTNKIGVDNSAVGVGALQFATGNSNSAHGYQALVGTTTGINNTAMGANALQKNTTGSNNTAVGSGAGPDSASTNLTNATAIGANAVVSQSNSLVLGGTGAYAVNVGIGTTKPAYTLDVQGTGNFAGLVNFSPSQTFPGTGSVTSVGFTAPANDFSVTGSPITKSGTLALNWGTTGPTDANIANAIVRRDGAGSFSLNSLSAAGTLNVTTGNLYAISATSTNANAYAIFGHATSVSGGWGVEGISDSPNGIGVFGEDDSSSGGIGVYGAVSSAKGVAAIFANNGSGEIIRGVNASTQVFDVAGDGTVKASGPVIGPAGTAIPLAFADIQWDGQVVQSGTSNVSVSYDNSNQRYVLTIAGVTYDRTKFTTVITPSAAGPHFYDADTGPNGTLVVNVWDKNGNRTQMDFQIVVFQAH